MFEFKSSTVTSSIINNAMYGIGDVNYNIQWEDGNHTGCILTLEVGAITECMYVLCSVTGKYYAIEVDNKLLCIGSRSHAAEALGAYIKDLCIPWF